MPDALDFTEKQLVLLVDDTAENLHLLNALLKEEYRTRIANNGERALKAAAQDPRPDLILLDIMMPGMDGYEVCSRLKASDSTRDIPVIFITAKTDIEDAQRGFDLGGADYITKPILPPVVLARISTHIGLKLAREFMKGQTSI